MKINLSSPDITQVEIDAVVSVLKTPNLSMGPKLPEFERNFADFIGRKYAIAVNSGTSGLYIALLALGIGPGDEVITTPFSFITTTNVILMAGATPVFAEIDPVTLNIDLTKVKEKITPNTKAIMPVEVFGNPAGIDEIYNFAQQNNLICIEDSCEALGSVVNGCTVGTLGDVSAFAFYPNKQMTTGEGGIVLTDNEEVANLCKSLRNQGRDDGAGWLAHARLGYNYRLSDINCALGIVQLSRIPEFVKKRAQVAKYYQDRLSNDPRLIIPYEPKGCTMSWFVFVLRLADNIAVEKRNQILEYLRNEGIGCNNYFTPIHLQPFIVKALGTKKGDFPITEQVVESTIALPFYNNLSEADVETVCKTLKTAMDKIL